VTSGPCAYHAGNGGKRGRGGGIRTHGPCLPNAVPLDPTECDMTLFYGNEMRSDGERGKAMSAVNLFSNLQPLSIQETPE